mmetsp:Transcript_69646/g.167145  ORF Transcript_69646/g.167145 Transcript_69646/m.167145 type:complete len:337 (+) Transcript_69646:130-1140(+)
MQPQEGRAEAAQLLQDGPEEAPPRPRERPDRGPHYSQAQATFRFGGTGLSDGLFDLDAVECFCCLCNPTASCSYGPFRMRTDLKRMSCASWLRSTIIAIMWTAFMVCYVATPIVTMHIPPNAVSRSQDLRLYYDDFMVCLRNDVESNEFHCKAGERYRKIPAAERMDEFDAFTSSGLWFPELQSNYSRPALPGDGLCEKLKSSVTGCMCQDPGARHFIGAALGENCDLIRKEAIEFQMELWSWIILRDFLIMSAMLVLFTLVKFRYRLKHGFPLALLKACACTNLFFLQLSRHIDRASGYLPMPSGHEGREVLVGDPVEVEMTGNTARPEDQVFDV